MQTNKDMSSTLTDNAPPDKGLAQESSKPELNKTRIAYESETLEHCPHANGTSSNSSGSNSGSDENRKRVSPNLLVSKPDSDETLTSASSEVGEATQEQGTFARETSSGNEKSDSIKAPETKLNTNDVRSKSREADKQRKQVRIRILGLDAWNMTYVRTRNNSLRCFPACRPKHRERSFCGLPITVSVDASSESESKQMVVLGSFRKVKTDVIKIGDKFSTVELTRMLGSDFIIGTFISYDKKSKQAKFKLGPPRKWKYAANTLSSTEMHTFTVYAFSQAGGKCIGRQDSPCFTIIPAWRQSASEITSRAQTSSDNDSKSASDGGITASRFEDKSRVDHARYPYPAPFPSNGLPPPYVHGVPPQYDPYSRYPPPTSWEFMRRDQNKGSRKKQRLDSQVPQDYPIPPHPAYYGPQLNPAMNVGRPPFLDSYGSDGPRDTPSATGNDDAYRWNPAYGAGPMPYALNPGWQHGQHMPQYPPFYGWNGAPPFPMHPSERLRGAEQNPPQPSTTPKRKSPAVSKKDGNSSKETKYNGGSLSSSPALFPVPRPYYPPIPQYMPPNYPPPGNYEGAYPK